MNIFKIAYDFWLNTSWRVRLGYWFWTTIIGTIVLLVFNQNAKSFIIINTTLHIMFQILNYLFIWMEHVDKKQKEEAEKRTLKPFLEK